MAGTLAANGDLTMERGALWVRKFIVQNENVTTAAMEFIVKYDGATSSIFELVVGAGQITLAYGSHDVGDEVIVGTLITLTRTLAQTAALPVTRNASYSLWDAISGEHYAKGAFEIVGTVLT